MFKTLSVNMTLSSRFFNIKEDLIFNFCILQIIENYIYQYESYYLYYFQLINNYDFRKSVFPGLHKRTV